MTTYPDPPQGHYFHIVDRPWYDRDGVYVVLRRHRRFLWDTSRPEDTRRIPAHAADIHEITKNMNSILDERQADRDIKITVRDFNAAQRRDFRGR